MSGVCDVVHREELIRLALIRSSGRNGSTAARAAHAAHESVIMRPDGHVMKHRLNVSASPRCVMCRKHLGIDVLACQFADEGPLLKHRRRRQWQPSVDLSDSDKNSSCNWQAEAISDILVCAHAMHIPSDFRQVLSVLFATASRRLV